MRMIVNARMLLLCFDNLGYGDLEHMAVVVRFGHANSNIDALALESLVLTQFFVEPGCTPSRAALMTGRYSVRSGLNSIIVAGTSSTLKAEEFTMAELFKKHGYNTGMANGTWDKSNRAFQPVKVLTVTASYWRQQTEHFILNPCVELE